MNSALSHQLEAAIVALASHGTLKERLCAAFGQYLSEIQADELPVAVQHDFAEMAKAMHRIRALPGDTAVRASVRKFSNVQTQCYAALIVRLYTSQVGSMDPAVRAPARLSGSLRNPASVSALLAIDSATVGAPARAARAASR